MTVLELGFYFCFYHFGVSDTSPLSRTLMADSHTPSEAKRAKPDKEEAC
jgi:hypothetical protein